MYNSTRIILFLSQLILVLQYYTYTDLLGTYMVLWAFNISVRLPKSTN